MEEIMFRFQFHPALHRASQRRLMALLAAMLVIFAANDAVKAQSEKTARNYP
jgi:hypothetical protein